RRTIFSTVRAPHDPALTVGSLAITHTGRPSTVPTPVTTPSARRSSATALARRPSSTNEPGSTSRSMRSRTKSLPCFSSFSPPVARLPAAARSRAAAASWRWSGSDPADGEDGDAIVDGPTGEVRRGLEQGLAQYVGSHAGVTPEH